MHSAAIRSKVRELVAAGLGDREIARRTGLPRTTVRYMRAPRTPRQRETCPRCWRAARPMRFTAGEYAELLGL